MKYFAISMIILFLYLSGMIMVAIATAFMEMYVLTAISLIIGGFGCYFLIDKLADWSARKDYP